MTPESIALEGEVFPIEYVGAHVGFSRYGYRTDFAVTGSGGADDVFKDGMYHIQAGATGRLPLFKNAPAGPLDILLDLGYHAQDVVVFHRVGEEDNTWTWENLWLHGFRMGFGVRFQIVPWAQVHGGWHGTIIASGLITNQVVLGGTFRVWKGLTLDARYQGIARNLHVTSSGRPDEGDIHEESHGLLLGAGWSF
jgi:hypothetical protein